VLDGDADATRDILPADSQFTQDISISSHHEPEDRHSRNRQDRQRAAGGLSRAGYEVRSAKRGQIVPTASWADVIILAVPFRAVPEVARELGTAADGKTVVDVTNAPDLQLAVGFTTSGAEELQKALPRANVVKAFNTVFAQHMGTGKVNGEVLTAFVARDKGASCKVVLELAKAIGFDAVDGGPLKNARYLEPLAFLNVQLSWVLGNGPNVGFKFVH
jgi:predicted dinucleotide-binding enzyme